MSAPHAIRPDIQALRAFAVLAVVLFHLWPARLPGGYVGVDVFFVISGFLITGQLVRRRERDGRISLASFWASRARRLLPVSLFVLLVSVILVIVWAPRTLVTQYMQSIIASALYVENWLLAANGVDYLAHDNAPPIAQHYWSLSVEEQFYVLWPLLILCATIGMARARRQGSARRRLRYVVGVVTVLSFALSLWLTFASPSYAYFATFGRMWEFGIGALVALSAPLRVTPAVRTAVYVGAIAALTTSIFLLNEATPFPGSAALIPTIASVAIIAVGNEPEGQTPRGVIPRMMALRPVQWIGDQSYGIYLWHWPLIVIAPAALGTALNFGWLVMILLLTIIAAAMTKRFIEDPIRYSSAGLLRRPRVIALGTVLAMTVVTLSAAYPIWTTAQAAQTRAKDAEQTLTDPSACVGANALLESSCASARSESTAAGDVLPSLASLYDDTGGAYACYDQQPVADPAVCTFGSERPDALRIALTGDSHAAMLIPALQEIAVDNNWTIDTYVGRGCVWLSDPARGECSERRASLERIFLSGEYDVIVATALNPVDRSSTDSMTVASQMAAAWASAEERGVIVIGVADNPAVPEASADCLASASSFSLETCAFPADEAAFDRDPIRVAAAETGAAVIDLSAAYCLDGSCPMVAGGVVVYRDLHHITATYSRSLAPALEHEMREALDTAE